MSGRWFTYQSERFPVLILLPVSLLVALGASLYPTVSANVPFSFAGYFCSSFVAFCFLALTRIADEHRDYKYDTAHHPERPVPSGLVSLRELRVTGMLLTAAMLIFSALISLSLIIPLLGALFYYLLNSCSFFMKNRLFKHTGLFIFTRSLTLVFIDVFTITAQCLKLDAPPSPLPLICFLICRLFAAYSLDIAFRKNAPQASKFKHIRANLLFISTTLSFAVFILAMLQLNRTPSLYYIASAGYVAAMICIFFSNTNHRLFKLENSGMTIYCLIVALLPCFASRLI